MALGTAKISAPPRSRPHRPRHGRERRMSDIMDRLDELERVADHATRGPWEPVWDGDCDDGSPPECWDAIVDVDPPGLHDLRHADGEFIVALDPPTVLALIRALRARDARVRELQRIETMAAELLEAIVRRTEATND